MDAMRVLLGAKAKVDAADHKGVRPLVLAAVAGLIGSVEILVDAGADVAGVLPQAAQSCFSDAAQDGHNQVVRLLIRRGADPNECAKTLLQPTAMVFAASRGYMQLVQMLLDAGVDVNAVSGPLKSTALQVAALGGQVGTLQLLLAKGADPKATMSCGKTAVCLAAQFGGAEVIKVLLTAGADVHHALPSNANTALHTAAAFGRLQVTELLLSAGANLDARDSASGRTPLHLAAAKGHAAVACKLLAAGADVHATTNDGRTPLMLAAAKGHLKVVEVLVASGADSQQALVIAARIAAAKGQMALWAFLARKVQGLYPQALPQCTGGMNVLAALRALVTEWAGEVEGHEKILEAARRERAEGEAAREQAQQLVIQTALMQKQLGAAGHTEDRV
jgi:ankyrin repeat protein